MIKANLQLMQHNPLSKIPVLLTEGGQPLYDSNVICEYLDATFPGGIDLIPQAGPERWQSLCWTALAEAACWTHWCCAL
jgi:glutathione S-transferase